jgi:hypothetical protein
MKVIVSLWDKPDSRGKCDVEEVELDMDELCMAAMRKAKRKEKELYNWQVERIEV